YDGRVLRESARHIMSCWLDRRTACVAGLSGGRCARPRKLRTGVVVVALALRALMAPPAAHAQDAVMSTTVAPLSAGITTSRINFDAVKPRPASDRGLT